MCLYFTDYFLQSDAFAISVICETNNIAVSYTCVVHFSPPPPPPPTNIVRPKGGDWNIHTYYALWENIYLI